MTSSNQDLLSRIGGAAQGGSTKTPQEREALDRAHQEREQDSSAGKEHNAPGAQPEPVAPDQRDREKAAQRR
jgi:hypothetical protein